MAATAPGTAKAGGTTSAPKTLPLGELKIMFFKFLEQQGYALPSECVVAVSALQALYRQTKGRITPTLLVKGSDDEDFQIVKRKNKRVARRLRKTSSSSQSNDSAMEVEQAKVKSTNHSDSSITSKKVILAKTVASNKEATTSSINSLKTTNVVGSKPSPPPRVKPEYVNRTTLHQNAVSST
ncbi:hypothetical protein EVAR_69073_1 [Eumeta japonica]|uniref:Uncharacterized protein n=1 Tax=Eumeta variegata TaxID=151549 RepID=A0A4C1ZHE3_EUMVA|nr:hypothetical protein EVAR_69073_1 [Eumeta japonica]